MESLATRELIDWLYDFAARFLDLLQFLGEIIGVQDNQNAWHRYLGAIFAIETTIDTCARKTRVVWAPIREFPAKDLSVKPFRLDIFDQREFYIVNFVVLAAH